MEEKWVDIKHIAEYLGVKVVSIRKWIREDKIPYKRIGKLMRFKVSAIDEWINSGKSENI